MKKFLILLLPLFVALPSFGAKKKVKKLNEPMEVYVAEAAANHMKRVETIGGLVRWMEKVYSPKEVKAVKKWMMENNVPENQFIPQLRVSGSTITVGKDQLTIKGDHFILNKKKFKMKEQGLAKSLGMFCNYLDCFNQKNAALENILFPKAHAIFGFLTGKFILGFIAGVILAKPVKRLWRRIFKRRGRGGQYTVVREEAVNRNPGEEYQCQNGKVILCGNGRQARAFNRQGQCVALPEGALEDGRGCEESAVALNRAVEENERRGIDQGLEGFESVVGHPKMKKDRQPSKVKGK